jgi:peptide chain release factor
MIYVQISKGRGPAECDLAVKHITDRIIGEGPNAMLVSSSAGSMVLSLDGSGASDYANRWIGTILWVCPLREGHVRKNWYVGVREIEIPADFQTNIKEEDLKWETKRASGKGGQHVNKTESAVRLTYLPLGITVIAEDERSQHRNRKIALDRLRERLKALSAKQVALTLAANWNLHNQVERGNPIRVFEGEDFKERK